MNEPQVCQYCFLYTCDGLCGEKAWSQRIAEWIPDEPVWSSGRDCDGLGTGYVMDHLDRQEMAKGKAGVARHG